MAEPSIAAKYELLLPTFPEIEVRNKEETRASVLASLDSVLRKVTDAKQRVEVEGQMKSWKEILDAEVQTTRELQRLVGPGEWLFVFRFVDGTKVETGYLTLSGGRIVQRHVLTHGEDFSRAWPEYEEERKAKARTP